MAIPRDYLATSRPRPYAEVRDMVQDGDIMMCAAHDAGSRLIRWATRSAWSHCGIAFWLHDVQRVMVLECVEKMGVRAVPLSDFVRRTSGGIEPYPGRIVLTRHRAMASLDPLGRRRAMAQFAFDRLGSRFSNKEMLKIGLRMALGRFAIVTPKRLRADDEYICSEYVAGCYDRAGISLQWDGLGFVAPADIADDPGVEPVAEIQT